MKKYYLIIIVLFMASCAKEKKFVIKGTSDLKGKQTIYLDEQKVSAIVPIDSAKISGTGTFYFKGKIDYPRFFHVHLGDNKLIPLLIAPGEKITLDCRLKDFSSSYKVSGSEGSEYIYQLNARLAETQRSLDSLENISFDRADLTEEIRQAVVDRYQKLIEDQRRYSIQFVLDHLQSMASIYALYQKIDDDFILKENRDIQLLKITGHSLDTLYPESKHVKALIADAGRLERQLITSGYTRIINEMDGGLPEISLPDPNGDTIKLSSLQNEVILLSFWASWNARSIIQNNGLKEVYEKYHPDGFEIYQVSLDSDREEWTASIKYDELPWINVSDLSYPQSYTAAVYNVSELPTSFLINREGEIVGKDLSLAELERNLKLLLN